jgi:hypothetical protein
MSGNPQQLAATTIPRGWTGLRVTWLVLALTVLMVDASTALAQSRSGWSGGRRYRAPPRFPNPDATPDRQFMFCRILYRSVRREYLGHGWDTDYPGSDVNFMKRFAEYTKTGVSRDERGEPNHVVVRPTDDYLFQCPFVFMSDVGTTGFTDEEVDRLRSYLLRGGFLYVDDFWGEQAWTHWAREIGRILPPGQYPIVDIPPDHPIFWVHYDVERVPQIPSIQYWRRSGGTGTSERGHESAQPHLRGISDENGRLMVVMSHNTDVADGWEREGEEYEFFHRFSADAYALAINIVVYALTH